MGLKAAIIDWNTKTMECSADDVTGDCPDVVSAHGATTPFFGAAVERPVNSRQTQLPEALSILGRYVQPESFLGLDALP